MGFMYIMKPSTNMSPTHDTPKSHTRVYPKIASNLVRAAKDRLYDFMSSQTEITEIYSCRGMFEIENSKVYRVNHEDGPTVQITLDNVHMVVDKGTITRTLDFQFPRSHTSRTIVRSTYKISKKSTVKFVTDVCDDPNDPYMDYYFITDNYDQKIHQMDMIEFLNLIRR
jgi:hypothetical protein